MSTNVNHAASAYFGDIDGNRWRTPGETKREKWAAQFMSAMLAHEDLKNLKNWVDYALVAREAVAATVALEAVLNEQTWPAHPHAARAK